MASDPRTQSISRQTVETAFARGSAVLLLTAPYLQLGGDLGNQLLGPLGLQDLASVHRMAAEWPPVSVW